MQFLDLRPADLAECGQGHLVILLLDQSEPAQLIEIGRPQKAGRTGAMGDQAQHILFLGTEWDDDDVFHGGPRICKANAGKPSGFRQATLITAQRFPLSHPAEGTMTVARKKAAHAQRGKAELNPHDALVLLTADHNEIEKLVREFDRLRKAADGVEKGKAALRICHALEVHIAIKREVFYPAAEAVLEGDDKELLGKARIEHDGVGALIDKVEGSVAEDPSFDATVAVLTDQALRLMKKEEDELFPRLRHSRLDLVGTGERMAARKNELATRPIDREAIGQARRVMGGRL